MRYLLIKMCDSDDLTVTKYATAEELVLKNPGLIVRDQFGELILTNNFVRVYRVDHHSVGIAVDDFYAWDEDFRSLIPYPNCEEEEEELAHEGWIEIDLNGLSVKVPAGTTQEQIAAALGNVDPCC